MVGFLRLCQHFAKKRKLGEELAVVDKTDRKDMAAEEKENKFQGPQDVVVQVKRRRVEKVKKDQCVQAEFEEGCDENDDENKSGNGSCDKVVNQEEEEAVEDCIRGLAKDIAKATQVSDGEDNSLESDFIGAIDAALEMTDQAIKSSKIVVEIEPKNAIQFNVHEEAVVVNTEKEEEEEDEDIIDVVSVTPLPDIGQTEHDNVFLQNYFNPPVTLEFPFKEDLVEKETDVNDETTSPEPILQEYSGSDQEDDSDDDSVVCLTDSPTPAEVADAILQDAESPRPAAAVEAAATIWNYETCLASQLDSMLNLSDTKEPNYDGASNSLFFTAPKVKYHQGEGAGGANEDDDGDDEVELLVARRCRESRMDRNRCKRKKRRRIGRKNEKKCKSDTTTTAKKRCRKCALKKKRVRSATPGVDPNPFRLRQLRIKLLDIATDARFISVIHR
jgi:hypothetical protein